MRKRTIAIAGSLAALAFTAAPIAAATAATGHPTPQVERAHDRSVDRAGGTKTDRSVDASSRSGQDRSSLDRSLDR